ncbi:hypothetical protein FNV43_RR02710 [Rhamnella rubrinervis]|uniref:Uncharacterized protein n=1 Tax=Rhamnella rubrinervis TaxID=2594499 RepID=A0A8K0HGM5_9ROSA|nr:hypothetical protein FNV43_RR02710 [Rhamnella rubrinervis]
MKVEIMDRRMWWHATPLRGPDFCSFRGGDDFGRLWRLRRDNCAWLEEKHTVIQPGLRDNGFRGNILESKGMAVRVGKGLTKNTRSRRASPAGRTKRRMVDLRPFEKVDWPYPGFARLFEFVENRRNGAHQIPRGIPGRTTSPAVNNVENRKVIHSIHGGPRVEENVGMIEGVSRGSYAQYRYCEDPDIVFTNGGH